jgi:hypothetical protein
MIGAIINPFGSNYRTILLFVPYVIIASPIVYGLSLCFLFRLHHFMLTAAIIGAVLGWLLSALAFNAFPHFFPIVVVGGVIGGACGSVFWFFAYWKVKPPMADQNLR